MEDKIPAVTNRWRSRSNPAVQELVDAARKGDRAAFDELVRRTYDGAYTLALRLTGNPDDATDVVQEAFIRAFRGLRRFRGDAQFSTWLYRITANCASTHMAKRSKHRHDVIDDETSIIDHRVEIDPERATDLSSLRDTLVEAIDRLPSKFRAVVLLRDVYGLATSEVAEQLGLTDSAVKVRLHRARKRLRADLFPLVETQSERSWRAG